MPGSKSKLIRFFEYSAAGILIATASAKLLSSIGTAKILGTTDPMLPIKYRHLLVAVALVEMIVALIAVFAKRPAVRVGIVAWLATLFVLYRLGLLVIGAPGPCPCLGTLGDNLPFSPHTLDAAMRAILTYLLVGSYISLYFLSLDGRLGFFTSEATASEHVVEFDKQRSERQLD